MVGATFIVVKKAGFGVEEFDWLDVKAGFLFEFALQSLDGVFAELESATRPVVAVELGRD